ncbi:MAG: DUF4838 domain-containing protein [Clostridia bacterium]|nr:DUF4838 domain-containing protein [Clostridia bacterium]
MKKYQINKITSSPVVDFAAEELKKYLRMMMPYCGEIDIRYAPEATEGFRLGIMDDFGLDTSEAEDLVLDDILHIDTDEAGGIIAGSNVRSVLLAVYRYLTMNGCRWLFPGIDGEFIPVKGLEPVKFHKMADCRYRGECNEGAESQPTMIDAIDFAPKIGLNVFMIEFFIPTVYYNQYYDHASNEANREAESVTPETILQWKRQCEVEIAKRGLQLHDIGHGWPAQSFGFETTDAWYEVDPSIVPEESIPYLAEINGKRGLFRNTTVVTNACMSNPEARAKMVQTVADYAELATNVDYLHVWLADSRNNHCECEECVKMSPSDWYMVWMNELDEELTRRNLDTRIVFCCYVDTTWAPTQIKLNNPDRFSLLVGAISRNYTEPVTPNLDYSKVEKVPYVRNNITLPTTVDGYLAHVQDWREHCKVNSFVYEYHFWLPQYRDLGLFDASKIIYNDVRGYKSNGLGGLIEDGSQRSFFPNGFPFYVYASTLFDTSVDFEALKEDYFSHAYGEDWREVAEFFEKLGSTLSFKYMNGKMTDDPEKGNYYKPDLVENLRKIGEIVDEFEPFIEKHKIMPMRAQTVAVKILKYYLKHCKGLAKVLILKAVGAGVESQEAYYKHLDDFGKYEIEIEPYYDQFMAGMSMRALFGFRGTYIPF